MILRKTYLDRIIPLIDKNLIKVLTGVRRSGKTVLLQQIGEYLVANGRSKDNIVYINFESKANAKFKNADVLYDFLIGAARAAKGKVYILLDEIQSVEKWEEVASSLLVDIDCDIYITGSNSKLLSGELATLIAGRYIQTICAAAVCRKDFLWKTSRWGRIFRTPTTRSSSKTSCSATASTIPVC